MPLGLRDLFDMEDHRRMCQADRPDAGFKSLAHPGIIPGLHPENVYAIGTFFFLEPFQRFRDRPFRCLKFAGYRDPISVIPDKNGQGDLQYPRCIQRLPKMSFTRRRIADGAKAYFVTLIR